MATTGQASKKPAGRGQGREQVSQGAQREQTPRPRWRPEVYTPLGQRMVFGPLERQQSFLQEPEPKPEPNPYERLAQGEREAPTTAPERPPLSTAPKREAPSIAPRRQKRSKGGPSERSGQPLASGVPTTERIQQLISPAERTEQPSTSGGSSSARPEQPSAPGGSSSERIALPRAPGVNDAQQRLLEQCHRLWNELENDRFEIEMGGQQRGQLLERARQPGASDVRFLSWLQQESNNFETSGAEMTITVSMPQERQQLYKWLRFYYEYMVLCEGSIE